MSFRSLLELDSRLSDQLRVAEQPGLLRSLSVFFAHSGDSWFWWIGLLIVWLLSDDSFWKQWAMVLSVGIAGLAFIVLAIKFSVRRRRPEGEWGGIYRNTDPHSFPSGHAARAFMIAVVATGLGPAWLAAILWIWAPLVSLARVAMGVHYASDIIAGMLVGIIVGLIGLQIYEPLLNVISALLGFPLW